MLHVKYANIISYLPDIYFQTPNSDFFENSAFESGLLFLRNIQLFLNFVYWLCSCEGLLPRRAYRLWDHLTVLINNDKILADH